MQMLKNIQKNVMTAATGVAGGAASRVVANKVLPMVPFVKDYPKYFDGVNFLLGCAMMDMKGTLGEAAYGYAVVAGTDAVADFVPMLKPSAISDNLDALADELADELEQRLADDVANAQSAMNGSGEDFDY